MLERYSGRSTSLRRSSAPDCSQCKVEFSVAGDNHWLFDGDAGLAFLLTTLNAGLRQRDLQWRHGNLSPPSLDSGSTVPMSTQSRNVRFSPGRNVRFQGLL